jgi:hypothetical protein
MKIDANACMCMAFNKLQRLIETKQIMPGTMNERDFLSAEVSKLIMEMLKGHNVNIIPQVTVNWDVTKPDELKVILDDQTKMALKDKGLL